MSIPIIELLKVILLAALAFYLIQLIGDAFVQKVARIVIVVLVVLWFISLLGGGPIVRIG